MLNISHLTAAYNRKVCVLNNLSFSLDQGFTMLIGENGSGKSTLLKAIVLAISSERKLELNEQELEFFELKKVMSYLPQEFDVYPNMKVRELLEFVAEAKGIGKHNAKSAVLLVAERTNITKYLNNKMCACSLGTRRRVGIASALLGDPKVVLLDEPTAGVDPQERQLVYEVMRQCFSNKIVLMSTHVLEDIQFLANRIIMLDNGKFTFDNSYQEFCSLLDGRLFEYQGDLSGLANMPDITVLSTIRDRSGKDVHKVVMDSADCVSADFTKLKPDLVDCWSYLLKRGNQ